MCLGVYVSRCLAVEVLKCVSRCLGVEVCV